MSIVTQEQLWAGFDYSAPSNPTIVRESLSPIIDKSMYFSGLKTFSGTTRIYARFLSIESDTPLPCIIILPSSLDSLDDIEIDKYLDLLKGYSLMFVDYFGSAKTKLKHTIYPKDIDAYWQRDKAHLNTFIPEDLKTSAHYYFSTTALFSVNYLRQYQNELNIDIDKIGIIGIGTGAGLVYKASIDQTIKCGASFFCGDIFGQEAKYIGYKAALDSRMYATKTDIPVLINAATNQIGGGFDYLNDLYLSAQNARLLNYSLSDNAISEEQRHNLATWFDSILKNQETALPEKPKILVSVSEGANYIELTGAFDSVTIYLAEDRDAEFRNWKKIKHTKISETKYLARIEPCSIKHKLFASVVTKCGFSLSSEMMLIKPSIDEGAAAKKGRILFKSGLNKSDWLIKGHGFFDNDGVPIMAKGPFDLEGIKGKNLISLASGDAVGKRLSESLLQFIIHAPLQTEVEFNLTLDLKNGMTDVYSTKKTIQDKDWAMVTLSPIDFKCAKGIPSFDKVISIGAKASTPLIISSIIWV